MVTEWSIAVDALFGFLNHEKTNGANEEVCFFSDLLGFLNKIFDV